MKKLAKMVCSLLLVVAPVLVVGTFSLGLWEDVEVPESLR